MPKNKYLLLASSLGVLALLMVSAVQENFLKEWRKIQSVGMSDEGSIDVRLRQVINPGLRVTDRCVSCHVTMGAGEGSVRGAKVLVAHKAVVHDPTEYGCTVCHGGQGLATEKADAHGDVHFWPEPMLPARYSYAGCGTCHAPLNVPNSESYRRAVAAFERLDCYACHRVEGKGGTIRPDGSGMEGPDLSRAGLAGYDRAWYSRHLSKMETAPLKAWKASFAPVTEADQQLLGVYLSTCVGASKLVEAKSAFHTAGCLGCHKVSGVGGDSGPDLSRAGEKDPALADFAHVNGPATLANWQAEHLRSPLSIVTGSQMPSLGLDDRDIDQLVFYTLSLRRREVQGNYVPKDRMRAQRFGEREFSSDGGTVYGTFCAGCHGLAGSGIRSPGLASFPSIANPDLLERVSDQFLEDTIRHGRPGRRMPAWGDIASGLKLDEIRSVIGYLRVLSGAGHKPESAAARWVKGDPAAGKALFASTCAGCHGASGEGAEAPALNNQVLLNSATDTYLVETIGRGRRGTVMQGFVDPSPARRTLSPHEIESVVAFVRTWEKKGKP
ncbi:MAG: c-type cytochrome [Bryobacteraceae bacterium]|nr:c-type cytochrome [Bryobacteraceae bacterium]